jgi:hypothetical protein
MTIRSRPATREYRENFDRAFGRAKEPAASSTRPGPRADHRPDHAAGHDPDCSGCRVVERVNAALGVRSPT